MQDPTNNQPMYPSNDPPPAPGGSVPVNQVSAQTSVAPSPQPQMDVPPAPSTPAGQGSVGTTIPKVEQPYPPIAQVHDDIPFLPKTDVSSPVISQPTSEPRVNDQPMSPQPSQSARPVLIPEPAAPQPVAASAVPGAQSVSPAPIDPVPPIPAQVPQSPQEPVQPIVQTPISQPSVPVIPTTQPVLTQQPTIPVAGPEPQQSPPVVTSQPLTSNPIPQQPQNQAFASVLTPGSPMPQPAQQLPQAVPAAQVAAGLKQKSKMPKIILFIALGVLALTMLAYVFLKVLGTGSGTGSTVGKKGEITWWGHELDEDVVKPLIDEYQSSHQDVKITYVKQSATDYRERLTNALAKGTGPDIFEIHNTWPAMFKNDVAALPTSVMSASEYTSAFYPIYMNDLKTQKGIVGIPLLYDAITLYVNEDIFASALKTAPKTWTEVQTLADAKTGLTQKDQSGRIIQAGIALGTTDNVEYWPEIVGLMLFQNKAQFTNMDAQTTKDVISFYNSFGKQAGNWDSTLPASTQAFAKQKVAMILAPSRAANDILQQSSSLRFKTYNLPQLPKETPTTPDMSYATYWAESVWERSASKDSAWDFLKFMSSEQSLQKINQNLEAKKKVKLVYPRPNMAPLLANDPILGSVVALAPVAKSWYLADKTNDGQTGLNTLLKNAYAKALTDDPKTAATDITKIMTQYGLTAPK